MSHPLPAQAVTCGPKQHFFGYYDKCPWDVTGRSLLALETDVQDRSPGPDDQAVVAMVDLRDGGNLLPLATTRAWNWQQGAMLQWLPSGEILFNDRDDDRYVAVVLEPHSGRRRRLPLPVHAVSPDGRAALTCDFARLYDTRPGYGYAGLPDPYGDDPAPDEDGVWWMDLATGEHRLLLSLGQLARAVAARGYVTPPGGKHWVNHLQFNTDGSRFVLLHRCGVPRFGSGVWWTTWMFTANPDGSDLFCLSDSGMVSHFDWRDPEHLLAWAQRPAVGDRFFLFQDRDDRAEVVADGALTVDGHCSYSPDRRWLMSDTYPDPLGDRSLLLYHLETGECRELGRFYGPFPDDVDLRCDLHARWSRDGRQICLDSVHEGSRQMYVLDAPDQGR